MSRRVFEVTIFDLDVKVRMRYANLWLKQYIYGALNEICMFWPSCLDLNSEFSHNSLNLNVPLMTKQHLSTPCYSKKIKSHHREQYNKEPSFLGMYNSRFYSVDLSFTKLVSSTLSFLLNLLKKPLHNSFVRHRSIFNT